MKIGDIVIVRLSDSKLHRGIILNYSREHTHYLVQIDNSYTIYLYTDDFEPVNCRIGRQYNRFYIMYCGDGTKQIIDNYATRVVVKGHYKDGKWQ